MKHLKRFLPYLIVALVSYLYLSLYSHYLFATNPGNDEGLMSGAWRIMHGQMIYRDFFQVFFPGDFYLMAWLYRLFGFGIVVSNYIIIIMSCIISVLLYHISRLVIKRWYAVLAPLLFLTFGYTEWFTLNYYIPSTITLLLALIVLDRFMHTDKSLYLYLAGLLAGLTMLILQSTGVYMIVILTPLIYFTYVPGTAGRDQQSVRRQRLYASLKFLSGAAVPCVLMLVFLAANGAFLPFLRDQYTLFVLYPKINLFYMKPVASLRYIVEPLKLLFIFTLAASLFLLFTKRYHLPEELLLCIGNIILFLNVPHHIMLVIPGTTYINMGLSIVFSVYILWRLEELLKRISWEPIFRIIRRLFSIAAFAGIGAVCVLMFQNMRLIDTQAYHFKLMHEHLWSFDRYGASTLVDFISKADRIIGSDRNVLAYPFAPLLYSVMNIENPTGYDSIPSFGVKYGAPRFMLADIVNKLKASHNKYIIIHNWSYSTLMRLYKMNNMKFHPNVLEKFILEHYQSVLTIGNFSLLKFTTSARASFVEVLLIGAVKSTGVFTLLADNNKTTPTLLDLLKYAGVVRQRADFSNIIIIRNGEERIVDLTKYFQTGDQRYNPRLYDHTVIYVPGNTAPLDSKRNMKLIEDFLKIDFQQSSHILMNSNGIHSGNIVQKTISVTIAGDVQHAGSFTLDKGARLANAFTMTGRHLQTADYSKIVILRHDHLIKANLLRYVRTKNHVYNPILHDNDFIYFPVVRYKTISIIIIGAVKHTGDFTLREHTRLADTFTLTGGPLPASNLSRIAILRHGRLITTNFLNYIQMKNAADNPLLQNNDIVYVPKGNERPDTDYIKQLVHGTTSGAGK